MKLIKNIQKVVVDKALPALIDQVTGWATNGKIEKTCKQYGVSPEKANALIMNIGELTKQLSALKLSGKGANQEEISAFIKGDLCNSLIEAIASSKNVYGLVEKISSVSTTPVFSFAYKSLNNLGYSKVTGAIDYVLMEVDAVTSDPSNKVDTVPKQLQATEEVEEIKEPEVPQTSLSVNKYGVAQVHEDMSDEEDEEFVQHLSQTFQGRSLNTPEDVIDTLGALATATHETVKFCEMQETKREAIRNEAATRIEQIHAMKESIQTYLDRSFDERRAIFQKEFELLDKAIEMENVDAMQMVLDKIGALASESPFKSLSNKEYVRDQLLEENSTFDI